MRKPAAWRRNGIAYASCIDADAKTPRSITIGWLQAFGPKQMRDVAGLQRWLDRAAAWVAEGKAAP